MTDKAVTAEVGFSLQLKIWGYACSGEILETAALIAEGHAELVSGGAWDRPPGPARALISRGGEPYRPVKDIAALPWAAVHCMRGHEDWPGL